MLKSRIIVIDLKSKYTYNSVSSLAFIPGPTVVMMVRVILLRVKELREESIDHETNALSFVSLLCPHQLASVRLFEIDRTR